MAEDVAQHFRKGTVNPEEIPHYRKFGLGRGVNFTDPDMWKNKAYLQLVREPCKENISGTKELQTLESYKKEVFTFQKRQQTISLSLDKPRASQVRIEMDEEFSRSSTSTRLIEGKKIETRTISFHFHFNDVPLYSSIETLYDDIIDANVFEVPICSFQENESNWFEEDLADWLLKCIECREKKENSKSDECSSNQDSKKTKIKMLADKLAAFHKSPRLKEVLNDCKSYIEHRGITHYVSAIKLGACEYHTIDSKPEQTSLDISVSMATNVVVRGGFFKKEKKRKIGRIDMVQEEVAQEAVIGFEIQPLHKLVRIQYIQMALKTAIKEYSINGKLYDNLSLQGMSARKTLAWKTYLAGYRG